MTIDNKIEKIKPNETKLKKSGFEYVRQNFGYSKIYKKGNERVLYDPIKDKIGFKYEVKE